MKKIVGVFIIFLFTFTFFIQTADAVTKVRGYYKKNGTYVAPHYRNNKNSTKMDNYSTKGNINPYTGKKGTVNPYK